MTTILLATESVAEVAKSVADLGISLDTVWMLLAAMLVFFMQPGGGSCLGRVVQEYERAERQSCC